ncbi:MAG: hypothetical protein ACEQSR_12945 [Candidatus Methylacidiphilales bacterium]
MSKNFLTKLTTYLLAISAIYNFYKDYRKQKEWNASKKRNLAGLVISVLGVLFLLCVDVFELE